VIVVKQIDALVYVVLVIGAVEVAIIVRVVINIIVIVIVKLVVLDINHYVFIVSPINNKQVVLVFVEPFMREHKEG
jgi:hypothetical protein